jgi:glycine/D-amino acid oxidase-like deaminating enzyme
MNIQTGSYYWPNTFKDAPVYPPLSENITCDVLVVGGGSSGAQCAYYLAKEDLNVVVIEKGQIGRGSTSTNTCLLQYSGEKKFTDLVQTFGDDYITRHLQLCQQAIDDIEGACQEISFDAEFKRRDTLYYVSEEKDQVGLFKECEWLQGRGAPVAWVTEEWIGSHYSFQKPGAIYSRNDGEMNPFIFTHGLMEFAHRNGVKIFEDTAMVGEHYEGNIPVIKTNHGSSIRAKAVIYAAGYDAMEIKTEKKARFVSTYTVTTEPVDDFIGWYNRTLIWETARPYIYLRTTKDGRIIVGGLDEDTVQPEERDKKLIHKRDQLLKEIRVRFPDINVSPEYYSAAFYGGMVDGLPMVGMYQPYPNSYFLLGYGDNGTVYSMVLAKLIRDRIVKGRSEDIKLYEPHRPLTKKRLYK